jgi:hypothetical protein
MPDIAYINIAPVNATTSTGDTRGTGGIPSSRRL